MSVMRTQVITADTVDEAVERILGELKGDAAGTAISSGRSNVIYFDGWDGLGASAVLRAVGRRLTSEAGRRTPAATGLEFSRIFHIDCSKWESRRAMQRVIAEQLKLPASVMEILDAQDEEDDYQGVAKGSRAETPQVTEAIYQHIQVAGAIYEPHVMNRRFLVIFHNGSSEEIDFDSSFSFPLSEYSRNKVLWSFQGRFRLYPRTKVDRALKNTRTTDVFLSAAFSGDIGEDELMQGILRREAEEVARGMVDTGSIDWPAAVTSYFWYVMKLRGMGSHVNDYDMPTHASNYWICDDMIQLQQGDVGTDDGVDRLWLSSDALHREIQLDEDHYQNPCLPSLVGRGLHKRMACWASPTHGFMLIQDPHGQIHKGMIQQFDRLRVLKLSACTFSFTSPPFVCCRNLKFLWLDRCQDGSSTTEVVEEDIRRFFQSLWVLDVRYLKGEFLSPERMDLMTQLREINVTGGDFFQRGWHNIHRLRVKEIYCRDELSFSVMDKMELLEFSRNYQSRWLGPVMTVESCSNLETLIMNGSSSGLERISLTGCAKLKNLFLSGSFPDLYSIVITGAAVETLDLRAVTAPNLNLLFLLECRKLCAILWPPAVVEGKRKRYLDKLRIDTTQKEGTNTAAGRSHSELYWHISVRDTRILGSSLESVKDYFRPNDTYVEISSPIRPCAAGSKDDGTNSSSGQYVQQVKDGTAAMYADIADALKDCDATNKGDRDAPTISSMRPLYGDVLSQGCYIHIEDQSRARSLTANNYSYTLPAFICDSTKILHVHDSLFITSIVAAPSQPTWDKLEWCRVERCPKLECVFSPQLGGGGQADDFMFKNLRTVWTSHIPNARYIWKWSGSSSTWFSGDTFENLTFLHLEFCHRLIHIIHFPISNDAFHRLETLEIMWCGNLSVALHFYDAIVERWMFRKLKHIRLHELPKLRNICNIGWEVHMPELETIKIRGCWSLRALPIVYNKNVVKCDCEKEWWDKLEWESLEHASRYEPTHPRYYKKNMLKGSVLR